MVESGLSTVGDEDIQGSESQIREENISKTFTVGPETDGTTRGQ